MHKKFEKNWKKIKRLLSYQSERKVVTHNSKSDLPLRKVAKLVRASSVASVMFLRTTRAVRICPTAVTLPAGLVRRAVRATQLKAAAL